MVAELILVQEKSSQGMEGRTKDKDKTRQDKTRESGLCTIWPKTTFVKHIASGEDEI
jgi:hypothetical protein